MILNCGRKSEYLEKVHVDTRRTGQLHTETPWPRLKSRSSANHWTTVPLLLYTNTFIILIKALFFTTAKVLILPKYCNYWCFLPQTLGKCKKKNRLILNRYFCSPMCENVCFWMSMITCASVCSLVRAHKSKHDQTCFLTHKKCHCAHTKTHMHTNTHTSSCADYVDQRVQSSTKTHTRYVIGRWMEREIWRNRQTQTKYRNKQNCVMLSIPAG